MEFIPPSGFYPRRSITATYDEPPESMYRETRQPGPRARLKVEG